MAAFPATGGHVRRPALTALAAAACLAGAVLGAGTARGADPQVVTERTVKAAFLYKFAGYVEWPDSGSADERPLTIGVLGATEMASELARLTAGRSVNDRPVRVRQLVASDSLDDLQMLFVGTDTGGALGDSLSPARGLPILIVTDSPGALANGSIINFTFERDRVRFEVSLPAAERSRLKLSSRLLAVAQRVQRGPET